MDNESAFSIDHFPLTIEESLSHCASLRLRAATRCYDGVTQRHFFEVTIARTVERQVSILRGVRVMVYSRRILAFAATVLLALPVLSVRAEDQPKVKKRDVGKGVIEAPAKDLVVRSATPANPENPHVEPGKVQWHKSFAEACEASAKSKKPVLLFQMLGKLDDQFC
jgi:hypothetical protein